MKQKLKDIWNSSGRYFLLGLPVAAAVIAAAAWQANRMLTPPAQTIAQPPVEQEVTFDMEANRAYTSEDGIVVIQPSGKEDQAAQNMQKLQEQAAAGPEQVWAETIPLSAEDYTLPEEAALQDGSIGTLSIPKISLTAPVYETEDGSELDDQRGGPFRHHLRVGWEHRTQQPQCGPGRGNRLFRPASSAEGRRPDYLQNRPWGARLYRF